MVIFVTMMNICVMAGRIIRMTSIWMVFVWWKWQQAVMSLYGGGQMTGVAVDSGQVDFFISLTIWFLTSQYDLLICQFDGDMDLLKYLMQFCILHSCIDKNKIWQNVENFQMHASTKRKFDEMLKISRTPLTLCRRTRVTQYR